jgi:membrane protein
LDRERVLRTLTFWLRPAFALRVVNRFQRIAGFDRAMALASGALTALISLEVLVGTFLTADAGDAFADRIVERYDLSGGGAEAVRDIFAPAGGTTTSVSVIGALLLLLAVLSFTRAAQRLFEQTWELGSLTVRNTLNGLRWAAALVAYMLVTGWIHAFVGRGGLEVGAALLTLPLTALLLGWGGWVLSAKRIGWRNLVPFALIASALTAAYSVGASVYVPHLFSTYATRYGAIGAVLAIISTLFCVTLAVVGSAAIGREVSDELARIRRGERPPDDEVRREWDNIVGEVRARWRSARERIPRRAGRKPPDP